MKNPPSLAHDAIEFFTIELDEVMDSLTSTN